MSKIQLIKPNEGQKNWGNAINTNFTNLYNQYRTTLLELQGVKDRLEELDTLKIQHDTFIYINKDGQAYINKFNIGTAELPVDGWANPKTESEFDPFSSDYLAYDAWFVQTGSNESIEYGDDNNKYIWNTGDLLIIHKQVAGINSLNQANVTIEQWKNIMGGYYQPTSQSIDDDGILTTTYIKTPSFSTVSDVKLQTPHMYWKPTRFDMADSEGNKLIFEPYQVTPDGISAPLSEIDAISIPMTSICWGATYNISKEAIANQEVKFDIGKLWKDSNDTRVIEATAIFRDDDNNMLYFPYKIERTDNNLFVTIISSGSYSGNINAQITVIQDKTSEIRIIVEEIINNLNLKQE